MKLTELTKRVNILADEQETADTICGFINDAIAKINVHMKANFPMLDPTKDEEPAFPEKWQVVLLIPFAKGRIKEVDSSQFEYTDAYNEFMMYLDDMIVQYIVPEAYKDTTIMGATNTSDIYTNPATPWGWKW